jgi:hypothetical protein
MLPVIPFDGWVRWLEYGMLAKAQSGKIQHSGETQNYRYLYI